MKAGPPKVEDLLGLSGKKERHNLHHWEGRTDDSLFGRQHIYNFQYKGFDPYFFLLCNLVDLANMFTVGYDHNLQQEGLNGLLNGT